MKILSHTLYIINRNQLFLLRRTGRNENVKKPINLYFLLTLAVNEQYLKLVLYFRSNFM